MIPADTVACARDADLVATAEGLGGGRDRQFPRMGRTL